MLPDLEGLIARLLRNRDSTILYLYFECLFKSYLWKDGFFGHDRIIGFTTHFTF